MISKKLFTEIEGVYPQVICRTRKRRSFPEIFGFDREFAVKTAQSEPLKTAKFASCHSRQLADSLRCLCVFPRPPNVPTKQATGFQSRARIKLIVGRDS